MSFTGKATYSAGALLPELAEDVADVIGIVSPFETPLLDHLGDARRAAQSTVHEWLEDTLLPNSDVLADQTFTPDPQTATNLVVGNAARFREGDQLRPEGSAERMLVLAVVGEAIVVQRGYGGTAPEAVASGQTLRILGNAAFEGADRPQARFTSRRRRRNYTQIFTAGIDVSGSQRAAQTIGVADELEYQKQERLRELLRDLESSVINGVAPASGGQGSATVRRTMQGILAMLETHRLRPGEGALPPGSGKGGDGLTESVLNAALRAVWEESSGTVDTIVVGGAQKRRINGFASHLRGYQPEDVRYRDMVSIYESDFGVCRVVLSRWMPADQILLLDSSRVSVLPLSGRSFHYRALAPTGDADTGMVVGEYTLELMNENAHGVVSGLAA